MCEKYTYAEILELEQRCRRLENTFTRLIYILRTTFENEGLDLKHLTDEDIKKEVLTVIDLYDTENEAKRLS